MSTSDAQTGFTLLEVLVALAIVSIALVACMRALSVSANGTQAMQERSLALQAAENSLAELRLLRSFPAPGRTTQACTQGPLDLTCELEFQATVNGNFRLAIVRARQGQGPVLAELHGLLSSLP
jgi:general secretion pathway protein I